MKPTLTLLTALLMTSFTAMQGAESSKPNVLLIMTDDQGYGDFSSHGNPHLQTPHIDKLAQTGVRFDRFYVNSFCAPTRAALLTGRWPLRTGCHGVTRNAEAMKPTEVTIAEALHPAGYRSACIGKWHNGEQYPFTPQGQGFDEFFGFNNGHWNNYFDAVLLRGAKHEATQGYITDVLTDEAMKFITANKAKPFFCYLSYNAPHSPYQVPDTSTSSNPRASTTLWLPSTGCAKTPMTMWGDCSRTWSRSSSPITPSCSSSPTMAEPQA
jgi:arylsulfatase A